MRARLLLKLISVCVLLVITVLGARSCSGSSGSSPLNPLNVAHNGVASICANQQATAEASGDSGPVSSTLASPEQMSGLRATDPGGVQALQQALGGSLSCPTSTTAADGG